MRKEKEKGKRRGTGHPWLGAVLLAVPFAGAMAFAALRWGTVLKNLIHVVIKMVVVS